MLTGTNGTTPSGNIFDQAFTPLYCSDAYGLSDKPDNWAVPFAELEARVDNDETNFNVNIDCPLIVKSKL